MGYYRGFGEEHDIEGPDGRDLSGIRGMFRRHADAEFVAHAREDIPALIEALEASRISRPTLDP